MTTNVYLTPSTIQGGVYGDNGAYTFFLASGVCVLPKDLVEKYTQGNTPEERIEYVVHHGISSVNGTSLVENNNIKDNRINNFLNFRHHE